MTPRVDPPARRPPAVRRVRRITTTLVAGAATVAVLAGCSSGSTTDTGAPATTAAIGGAGASVTTSPPGSGAATSAPGGSTSTPSSVKGAPTTTAPAPGPAGGVVAQKPSWKLDAPMSRLVAVPLDGRILTFSGLDKARASMSRVFSIDPATGKATDQPKLPERLHDAAGSNLGSRVLMIGGGEAEKGSRDVTEVTANPPRVIGQIPEARSDVSAITVGDTLFVIGGYDDTNIIPGVLATTDGTGFRKIGDLVTPVRYGAVAQADGQIYVFGGKTVEGGKDSQTASIQKIDPASGQVTRVGAFPTPIGHAMAANLGGTIYVMGGTLGTANPTSTDKIWRFDPATGGVTEVGKLPYAVNDAAIAVVGDTAYILGGERNNAILADVATVKRA